MKKCLVLLLLLALGIAPTASAAKKKARKKPVRKKKAPAVAFVPAPPDATATRAAIEDLIATYGKNYPNGRKYLKQLETAQGTELEKLQREALAANPLVSDQPILFVARKQYKKDHHNTATLFQTGEINTKSYEPGGVLKMLDISKGWKTSTIFDPGPTGLVRDPELSFDGKRIVFSMRRSIDDDYHIYEINLDGTGLKQLTSAKGIADIDPLYLPNGDIVFSSSSEPKF
ncbi:MAG: hypothetical protein K9M45_02130, partial [Kiritimatiellales bacterium]|nr:hypothetical protein [Kiritimatiellales bacterium]